ncbi:MAG: bifunctional phosphoglucose/phosphomannose isomerase [Acidimicrobiales bacterium]
MTSLGAGASWLEVDTEQMLAASASLPDQISHALQSADVIACRVASPEVVVVFGMGGSAVAGAVLSAIAEERSQVPVLLASSYRCPAFVGPRSFVFAVSFSGETEETLEATSTAIGRGARVVALTGGGSLAAMVAEAGGEVLELPAGIPQPRAAIGAMVAPLLLCSEQLGLLPGARVDLEQAVAQLRRRISTLLDSRGLVRDEASEVARRVGRSIPLVHGASGLGAVAARRWKTQLNENAKAPAFHGEQPEVCHNEVCGFGQGGDVTRQLFTLVNLRLPREPRQMARRFDLVAEAVSEAVGDVVTVRGEGEGELAGFFDLVAIGDVVSLRIAGREGVDPGPVPALSAIKQQLRQHS